jgi:hypothetical protein
MRLIILKSLIYVTLIAICLELIIRVFHLHQEYPQFIINDLNVKTYEPNQNGYYTVGNRRMNFAEFHINKSGFNSYREFIPSKNKQNIALIGDSFIEGLHQNYYKSIGKKIENKLKDSVNVFEYGHSGYDFADQLYLIKAYQEKFNDIDKIIIYLKFENDLKRDFYEPDQYWIDSQYFVFSKIKKNIKLLSYMDGIGALEPLRELKTRIVSFGHTSKNNHSNKKTDITNKQHQEYLDNFKKLIELYDFDKNKTSFLLDARSTSEQFLNYCDSLNYKYIDFGKALEKSRKPTTLIYDMHWNNHGRDIIASVIADYIRQNNHQ